MTEEQMKQKIKVAAGELRFAEIEESLAEGLRAKINKVCSGLWGKRCDKEDVLNKLEKALLSSIKNKGK